MNNKQYIAMRRQQYLTIVIANATKLRKQRGLTAAELRVEVGKISAAVPGGPLTSKEVDNIIRGAMTIKQS